MGRGEGAPCVFQPLRQVGKALDVELLLLRSRSGPVTSSDKLRHPRRGPRPSLRLADAESRTPPLRPDPRLFPTDGANVEVAQVPKGKPHLRHAGAQNGVDMSGRTVGPWFGPMGENSGGNCGCGTEEWTYGRGGIGRFRERAFGEVSFLLVFRK